jgi:hypothetical protein
VSIAKSKDVPVVAPWSWGDGKTEVLCSWRLNWLAPWLDRSREALRDAAPYYAPKLHAVAIATPPSREEDDVGRVDPREVMWQTYKAMRERGELAMKTVTSTETNLNSHTAQPEPAVAVEEDNGDGEAV